MTGTVLAKELQNQDCNCLGEFNGLTDDVNVS